MFRLPKQLSALEVPITKHQNSDKSSPKRAGNEEFAMKTHGFQWLPLKGALGARRIDHKVGCGQNNMGPTSQT